MHADLDGSLPKVSLHFTWNTLIRRFAFLSFHMDDITILWFSSDDELAGRPAGNEQVIEDWNANYSLPCLQPGERRKMTGLQLQARRRRNSDGTQF